MVSWWKSNTKYPEGALLFDVRYYRKPECFEIVYFNPVTNRLEVEYEDPIIDIWFLKKEYRTNKYQLPHVEQEKCYPVYCKPSQVPKIIAQNIGGEWEKKYEEGKDRYSAFEMKKIMCECPWVFKADFLPDVYFRLRWLHEHGDEPDVSSVTFGLLDIECDVLDKTIDAKDIHDVTQPVNAATLILPHVKICALLTLGPRPKEKLEKKFWDLLDRQREQHGWFINHQEEFKRMIVEDDPDNKKYLEGYDIRIHNFDFEREIDLIKTIFDYINKYRPMFVMSWNAKFDDNYLMNRIEYLGYDCLDFIVPKEFKVRQVYYKEDTTDSFSLKNSKDWMFSSTYSVYICQMRLFAMIRKSMQERRSYSLSAVGKDVAGIDKLTQTKSGSFREFAYTDYLKFLLYNVRDVVVQLAIELQTNDCQSLVARSYTFATQYSKCFQETHIVRNTREYYFEQEGFVQACRLIIEPGIDTSFKGAFVAPPEKNLPTGLVLNGKPLNVVIFGALDADAASYYPSSKMGCNLDPMSLDYKCKIRNEVFLEGKCVNKSLNQSYSYTDSRGRHHDEDLTGPILNAYKNKNEASMLQNWMNMPSISEYFDYIDARISS